LTFNDQKERLVKVSALISLVCALFMFSTNAEARHSRHQHHHSHLLHHVSHGGTIVPNPHGCPRTNFCGCGASVKIFGHPIPNLFLAANWKKLFPPAAPAPGMAAVKQHHVWVLLSHLKGDLWMGYDANSGHHQTKIHPRRLAGFRVVNPHGRG
jgi:hypothetical protein